MTFATHLERQFMQRLRALAGSKRVLCLRARDSCKRCYKKAGSKQQNQAPKNMVLYRLTEEGLNAKKLPIPIRQRKPSNSN
jgi:hypothetical protein